MAEEFDECNTALGRATILIKKGADDIRVKFCSGKLSGYKLIVKFSSFTLIHSKAIQSIFYVSQLSCLRNGKISH